MSAGAETVADLVAARVKQEANRRFRDILAEGDREPAPYICECLDGSCRRAVWLTPSAYDRRRVPAGRGVTAPAHGPRASARAETTLP